MPRVAALLGLTLIVLAADGDRIDFERRVWPILQENCVSCHGARQHYSNLRLDSPERILRGGELGRVVVPGAPDESSLYLRVVLTPVDLDYMPLDGDPLSPAEQELLRRWIAEGADFGSWRGAVSVP